MPIYKTPRGYKIKNVPEYHKTKDKAKERLRAVKANKKMKDKIHKILKRYRVKSYRTSEEDRVEQVEYPISREILAEIIATELETNKK